MEIPGVGSAAAAAVIPGKAFAAFFSRIDIAAFECVYDIGSQDPVFHVAQQELFISHELMTRIKVSPGCHSKILRSASAAAESLVDAGTAGQIDHEMEKCKFIS